MVSSLLMCRHLCHCCDGVVALVAIALLSLLMRRRLAVANDGGNSSMGDNINDNCNSATNVNNDDNGAGDDDIDNVDCDGQWLQRQQWR